MWQLLRVFGLCTITQFLSVKTHPPAHQIPITLTADSLRYKVRPATSGFWVPVYTSNVGRSTVPDLTTTQSLGTSVIPSAVADVGIGRSMNWINIPTAADYFSGLTSGLTGLTTPGGHMVNAVDNTLGTTIYSIPTTSSASASPINIVQGSSLNPRANYLPNSNGVTPQAGVLPEATRSVSITTPSITLQTVRTSVLPPIVQSQTEYPTSTIKKPTIQIIPQAYIIPLYLIPKKVKTRFRGGHNVRKFQRKYVNAPLGGPNDKHRQSYYGPYFGRADDFGFDYGPNDNDPLRRHFRGATGSSRATRPILLDDDLNEFG